MEQGGEGHRGEVRDEVHGEGHRGEGRDHEGHGEVRDEEGGEGHRGGVRDEDDDGPSWQPSLTLSTPALLACGLLPPACGLP